MPPDDAPQATIVAPSESVLLVAGEASADHHGSDVLRALLQKGPAIAPFGIGGRAMRSLGLECIAPAEEIAVAGLTEVLAAVPRIWTILRRLTRAAQERRPKVAVLIDLPDFNLPLAKRLKRLGVYVIYYISPQVWAWRAKRVETIREVVDEMLVILPFEENFYRQRGVRATFVGHPLLEQLEPKGAPLPSQQEARAELGLSGHEGPLVALLPGSRRLEVVRHLQPMLAGLATIARLRPGVRGLLPLASTVRRSWVEPALKVHQVDVTVLEEQATLALCACDVAVVCSGTATLQTALVGRPMVVVYRVSALSYMLLRRLIRVPAISLVNLIAHEPLVPELIQHELTPAAVAHHILNLLEDTGRRERLVRRFAQLKDELGRLRPAPTVAARVRAGLALPSILPSSATDASRS